MKYKNYDKFPTKEIRGYTALAGWEQILDRLRRACPSGILVAEFYPGVDAQKIAARLAELGGKMFNAESCMLSREDYRHKISPFLTNDRVFGVMNTLRLDQVYLTEKVQSMAQEIRKTEGLRIVYGTGASLITKGDCLAYFDMSRWELECRFRRGAPNWHTNNPEEEYLKKFKQGFFVDWRMADRLKRALLDKIDYIVDTIHTDEPKMVCGDGFREGLELFVREPFRLVPYFAPEVWGGQWMKEVCDLPREADNYAWAFDGVPEENSIMMRFGDVTLELPALDVVFYRPRLLLGERVHSRFGDEFPIRFDFLDTMGGQNLSLQVHPLTEYIQSTFGMHYTQDESYYILDCDEGSVVYLGLKEGIDPERMLADLRTAQKGDTPFPAEKYVNMWPVKKHDHVLIPAGTIHCSGANTMVLEISATPYIFTFKLWDWGRLGLDGRPRPVHIDHGEQVIAWDRTTRWVQENLVGQTQTINRNSVCVEEKTGLHEREFIETRRYTLSGKIRLQNNGSVSMCNVVDGDGVIVSAPDGRFEPYTVHYAETFILPAAVEEFDLEPLDGNCMVLRASVR